MMPLPETNEKMRTSEKPVKLYIIQKVLTIAIQKSNLSNFVKSYGHLCEIFHFYHKHSPKMVESPDSWC